MPPIAAMLVFNCFKLLRSVSTILICHFLFLSHQTLPEIICICTTLYGLFPGKGWLIDGYQG